MKNPLERFSTRVKDYAKHRPGYPYEILDPLRVDCNLTPDALIADIGSGTGKLSEVFLKNGNKVIGVEPNTAMREAAEQLLKGYTDFKSVQGMAEATTLEHNIADFVAAGQAFHWFDRQRARREFERIMKPGGWIVLVWNERKLDSSPFLRDYENLLLEYGTDYRQVRQENVAGEIAGFFAPGRFRLRSFENVQDFGFEGLRGRVFSASYTPEPGDPAFEPMLNRLQRIFEKHESDGIVSFEYETKVYYGRLTA